MRKLLNNELKRITVEQFKKAEKSPFIVILDNVRSQSNVGSVFRTADAFRTEAVYLCGITSQPPHREIQKTALGATESVPWKYYQKTIDAVTDLKNQGYKIIGIEQVEGSVALQDMKIAKGERYALVFGNEVNGVDQEVVDNCDECAEIPQFGTKHSFNIAISAGIVLWELNRKMFIK
ncbi:MAG TPA: RNA methyltransferase [Bacteroidales bacterium]|nr:RNA methyltransferase [Bacteroidales bacterium]HPT21149.1 RNA methyltransferase [Bacteroidales bacterium]